MGLQVYNTLTRKKDVFETIEPKKVRMLFAGQRFMIRRMLATPCPHSYSISAAIWNTAGMIRHVMNYTDVDDKIISVLMRSMDPSL